MPVVTCVEDLRQMARKRVAKAVFDYVERGSYDEQTLRANRADLEALHFRQRVAITWTTAPRAPRWPGRT
jgi:L-lactate dehydrogenase (cytochrome)